MPNSGSSYDDATSPVTSPMYPSYTEPAVTTNINSSKEVASEQKTAHKPPATNTQHTISTADELYAQIAESQQKDILSYAKEPVPVAEIVEEKNQEGITYDTINAIFENCDVAVEWIDVLSHLTPTSDDFNADTWTYLHRKAVKVLEGDIDTYLEIISTINPYDDLLDYAENFEFGTDDASMMVVEFSVIDDNVKKLSKSAFEDYYSAIAIRAARDTFALLPVEKVVVHVVNKSKELLLATFDRAKFHEIDLVGEDASDTIKRLAVV